MLYTYIIGCRAALFSQHKYDRLVNCTACWRVRLRESNTGGCICRATGRICPPAQVARLPTFTLLVLFQDGKAYEHLVTYSAFHSHANYPKPYPKTNVYGQVRDCCPGNLVLLWDAPLAFIWQRPSTARAGNRCVRNARVWASFVPT